ncbi:MAG: DUF1820 family protein [bacterium]|nr:DUF1820 family protein [bacterium]
MTKKQERRVFKIVFLNQGKVCEIYATEVSQGALFGFVEVGDILFGERSSVVVDPSEESLKLEFDGVRRTYIPMHSVVRIDEVEKEGTARVTGSVEDTDKVTAFPVPVPRPESD